MRLTGAHKWAAVWRCRKLCLTMIGAWRVSGRRAEASDWTSGESRWRPMQTAARRLHGCPLHISSVVHRLATPYKPCEALYKEVSLPGARTGYCSAWQLAECKSS